MKKNLLLALLSSCAFGDSIISHIEEKTYYLKNIRIKRPKYSPLMVDDALTKTRDFLTKSISKKKYATPDKRLLILQSLYQEDIIKKKLKQKTTDITYNANHQDHEKTHLGALAIMQKGVTTLIDRPELGLKRSNLFDVLKAHYHHTNDPIIQSMLKDHALKTLFPKDFFLNIAAYSYNFTDYKNCLSYSMFENVVAIKGSSAKDFKISADTGFNVKEKEIITYSKHRDVLINLPSMETVTATYKNVGVNTTKTLQIRKIGQTREEDLFFRSGLYPSFHTYIVLKGFDQDQPVTYSAAELAIYLLNLNDKNLDLYTTFKTTPDQRYIPLDFTSHFTSTRDYNSQQNRNLLNTLLKNTPLINILKSSKYFEGNNQAPLENNIYQKLLFYSNNKIHPISLEHLEDSIFNKAQQKAVIAQKAGLPFHYISDEMADLFVYDLSEKDPLQLNDGMFEKLGYIGTSCSRELYNDLESHVTLSFQEKELLTHIDLPHGITETAEMFQDLLNKPYYRHNAFLTGLCKAIHGGTDLTLNPDFAQYNTFITDLKKIVFNQAIAAQESDIKKEDLENQALNLEKGVLQLKKRRLEEKKERLKLEKQNPNLEKISASDVLYHYILTLAILKNRQPYKVHLDPDQLDIFWNRPEFAEQKNYFFLQELNGGFDYTTFDDIPANKRQQWAQELIANLPQDPAENNLSWTQRGMKYIKDHALYGALSLFPKEIKRNDFIVDTSLYPYISLRDISKPGQGVASYQHDTKIPDPIYTLLTNQCYDDDLANNPTATEMALRMFVHWSIFEKYWFFADNREKFGDLSVTKNRFLEKLKTTDEFKKYPLAILDLLTNVYWVMLYGDDD